MARERAHEWAQHFHAAQAAPTLSCAVASPGGILWSAAYGTADLEFAVPARPEHLFRLGSVSKAVTATAAARLASLGLLELDVPISYWLPELPAHHRSTTMRQLLTHQGGGEQVSYSSGGYSLAALVMETAARQDFLDLITTDIAASFDLASLVWDQPGKAIPGRVRGYVGAEERRPLQEQFPMADWPPAAGGWAHAVPLNPAYCWAGAGLLMNMPDLARFGAAHLPGSASRITDSERALLFAPLTEASDSSPPLGLGWRVDRDASGRLRWHHAGEAPGGRCVLAIFPEAGLSVALASNTMTIPQDLLGPAGALADCFADL